MTGRAVIVAEEPELIAPLFEAYLDRFPKVAGHLVGETKEARAGEAVVVWCRPR